MPDELEECKDRNRKLEEENELLRQSAETFGALADRLNNQLHEEPAREPLGNDPARDPEDK